MITHELTEVVYGLAPFRQDRSEEIPEVAQVVPSVQLHFHTSGFGQRYAVGSHGAEGNTAAVQVRYDPAGVPLTVQDFCNRYSKQGLEELC